MSYDYQAEREAYMSLTKTLAQIEDCKHLFERAGLPMPEPLKRWFGNSNGTGKTPVPRLHIAPPHRETRPPESQDDWVSIEIADANATSLVLGVLRGSPQPLKAGDVIELVTKLNPKIPRGSIHNIGTRLDGKVIKRVDGAWSLFHPEKAPIIYGGYVWGPKEVFEKQELAAHRREAILHILRHFPGGLQLVQLVEQLRGCNWVHAPATKDLLRADIDVLGGNNKVRQISNSRKWELVP